MIKKNNTEIRVLLPSFILNNHIQSATKDIEKRMLSIFHESVNRNTNVLISDIDFYFENPQNALMDSRKKMIHDFFLYVIKHFKRRQETE